MQSGRVHSIERVVSQLRQKRRFGIFEQAHCRQANSQPGW